MTKLEKQTQQNSFRIWPIFKIKLELVLLLHDNDVFLCLIRYYILLKGYHFMISQIKHKIVSSEPSNIVLIVTDCLAISTSTSKISPSELCNLMFGIWKKTKNKSFILKWSQTNYLTAVYKPIRGGFKTQPPVDRRFRPVLGGCHCLE